LNQAAEHGIELCQSTGKKMTMTTNRLIQFVHFHQLNELLHEH